MRSNFNRLRLWPALTVLLVLTGCNQAKNPVTPVESTTLSVSMSTDKISGSLLGSTANEVLYQVTGPGMQPVAGVVGPLNLPANSGSINFSIPLELGPSRLMAFQLNDASTHQPLAVGAVQMDLTSQPAGQITVVMGPLLPNCDEINTALYNAGSYFTFQTGTLANAATVISASGFDIDYLPVTVGAAVGFQMSALNGDTVAYLGNGNLVSFAMAPSSGYLASSSASKQAAGASVTLLQAGDVYCVKLGAGGHAWVQVVNAGSALSGPSFRFRVNTTVAYYAYEQTTAEKTNTCAGSPPTPTTVPTSTFTSTLTPTQTSTASPTLTATDTFTPTPSFTPTNSPTITFTPTDSMTPTPSLTVTSSPTGTSSDTPTITSTPTNTMTLTDTSTPTNSPTATFSPTVTFTPTVTSSPTASPTPGASGPVTVSGTIYYTLGGVDPIQGLWIILLAEGGGASQVDTAVFVNNGPYTLISTAGSYNLMAFYDEISGYKGGPLPNEPYGGYYQGGGVGLLACALPGSPVITSSVTNLALTITGGCGGLSPTPVITPLPTYTPTLAATPTFTYTITPTITPGGIPVTVSGSVYDAGFTGGTLWAALVPVSGGASQVYEAVAGNNGPYTLVSTAGSYNLLAFYDYGNQFNYGGGVPNYSQYDFYQGTAPSALTPVCAPPGSPLITGSVSGAALTIGVVDCLASTQTPLITAVPTWTPTITPTPTASATSSPTASPTGTPGSGDIITVAGNGTPGSTGDSGKAVNAELSNPIAVAVDSSGNLYITDTSNNKIRKVDTNGNISTVAGTGTYGFSGDGGPATSAELATPWGVAVDTNGNIYIADYQNNVVREVSNGVITTVAGYYTTPACASNWTGFQGDGGPATCAQLNYPVGVAVDSLGNLYIADSNDDRVREVSGGIITTVAGGGIGYTDGEPATLAGLGPIYGVAVDPSFNLYLTEVSGYQVAEVSGGNISLLAGTGLQGYSGDGGQATSAELDDPSGVAVGPSGTVYIADRYNDVIRQINGGIISIYAGSTTVSAGVTYGVAGYSGDGGPATSAKLYEPFSVAVGPAGDLFIADTNNNVIRKVLH